MPLEHRLDRVEVVLVHAAEDEVRIARRRRAVVERSVAHEQLRDDLVGARVVEQAHVREVDDRERPVAELGELLLDAVADRRAGGARDEIGIKVADRADNKEPFQVLRSKKEKLFYDISWLGIYVGKAVLEANYDRDTVKITSRANSASLISTFYTVEDFAESLIIKGRASHFRIKQREGKYRSDKETIFDASSRKVKYFDHLKGKKNECDIEGTVWDILSGFYYLRFQPLIVGKVVYIDIFDSNKLLKAEVSVLRKEKIAASGRGEMNTIVVKPDLKSEGLFHRKGDVFIWLTDDEARIPVRLETKIPIGKVVAELKNSEVQK